MKRPRVWLEPHTVLARFHVSTEKPARVQLTINGTLVADMSPHAARHFARKLAEAADESEGK